MPGHRGIFVALEGVDGSGKTTQFNLLTERLRAVGYDVEVFDFPRYEHDSSYFVHQYLNGHYGPASQVNPYTASLFYALDRYEAAGQIRTALEQGKIVLSNRYAGSNMAHQGSKFVSEAEQRGFFVWADSLEFQLLGIPRPDINIFLRVPAEISFQLIGRKAQRSYTGKSHDEHESDLSHLEKSVATYDLLCRLFPRDFVAIDCVEDGKLLSVPAISDRIWRLLQTLLTKDIPKNRPAAKTIRLDQPNQVTEPVAAVGVDEVLDNEEKFSLSVKKTSRLGLRAAQKHDCRLVTTSQTDYKKATSYYTPPRLSVKPLRSYKQYMTLLDTNRRKILKTLKQFQGAANPSDLDTAVRPLLPMAELVSFKFTCDRANLIRLLSELNKSGLPELNTLAKNLTAKLAKDFTYQSDNSIESILKADDRLFRVHSALHASADLVALWPRLEFDLLADAFFESSDLAKEEIVEAISQWEYQRKATALKSLMHRSDHPISLDRLNYDWDIIIDGPALDYLLEIDALRPTVAQAASPRYGYEIPSIIENTGQEGLFSACFDASLELYSILQTAGHEKEAQYAVLSGHKQRWQASTNYNQLVSLHNSLGDKAAPGSLKPLRQAIFDTLREVHPLIAASITERAPRAYTAIATTGLKRGKSSKPTVRVGNRSRRHPKR